MNDRHAGETADLVRQALRAPPDVREVRSQSGRRMRIVRDPEPGVELELRETDAEGAGPGLVLLSLRDAALRPSRYPASLPFVPGAPAVVTIGADVTSVTWPSSDVPVGGPSESASLPEFSEIAQHLKPLANRLQHTAAASGSDVAAEARELVDSFDVSIREKLRAAWERTRPEAPVLAESNAVFHAVTQATEADGWERGKHTDSDFPFQLRTAEYHRDDEVRTISLIAMARAASMVQLMQVRRSPQAAT